MTQHLGVPLPAAPSDGVTVLRFAERSHLLLAASWDTYLRLYDVAQQTCRASLKLSTPILDCNFRDENVAFSAGLDGQVLSHDFESKVPPILLGNHQKPIKSVEYCAEKGLVVSSGWDRLVKFWDPRRAHHRMPVTSFELPGKVYTTAQTNTRLVVGTSEKHIFIFDLRKCEILWSKRTRHLSILFAVWIPVLPTVRQDCSIKHDACGVFVRAKDTV